MQGSSQYSAVITVFNDEAEIEDFLNNLTSQTLPPSEIIITDGGSSDKTVELVNEYIKRTLIPITVISGKRLNVSQGLNSSIEQARYEYIAICAVGNIYPDNYFSKMMGMVNDHDNPCIIASNVIGEKENTLISKGYSTVFLSKNDNNFSNNHGMIIKKGVFDRIGYFYEGFKFAGEDEEYLQRAVRNKERYYFIKDLYVVWKIPRNIGEFIRQNNNYVVAILQIYENQEVLRIYKKSIVYCFTLIATLISAFLSFPIRWMSVVFIFGIVLINLRVIVKKNFSGMIVKNLYHILTFYHLVKNNKYFKNENKIKKEFRIIRRISLTKICNIIY